MAGGLNLHNIISGAIGAVNPFVLATWRQSTGYTTNADGTRTSATTDTVVYIQVQALNAGELRQLEGLNIQGIRKAIYMDNRGQGVVRVGKLGGDMFKFYGQTWLAVSILENWSQWTKIAVVEQLDGR